MTPGEEYWRKLYVDMCVDCAYYRSVAIAFGQQLNVPIKDIDMAEIHPITKQPLDPTRMRHHIINATPGASERRRGGLHPTMAVLILMVLSFLLGAST